MRAPETDEQRSTRDAVWQIRKRLKLTREDLHLTKRKSAPAGLYFDLVKKTYETDGLTFEVPRDMTTRSFRARFLFDNYEQEERLMLRRHLPTSSRVLELGACIGVVSCVTNAMLDDREAHVVVEANPRLISWIDRNKQRNAAGFAIEHCMVSESADGSFYIHELIVGGSADRKTGTQVQVPVKTVSEIERAHHIEFDALVMDIEGGELDFLRENPDLLGRLNFACVELHEFIIGADGVAECEELLADSGLVRVDGDEISSAWKRPS